MKRPLVRLKVVLFSLAFSIVLNSGLAVWMNTKTLNTFRLASVFHTLQYRINDLLHLNYVLIEKNFDEIVDDYDLTLMVQFVNSQWTYQNDHRFWDVANPPVQSFLENTGDCDDYARLITYILHKKHPAEFVYYVMMAAEETGHATAVYYDLNNGTVNIIDVSGFWVRVRIRNFDAEKHVPMIVKYIFPDTIHVDVRTWDTRKSIVTTTTNEYVKELPDANYTW